MRATLTAPILAAALALLLGASVAAVPPVVQTDATQAIDSVAGTMLLDPPATRGEFSVDGSVLEYRAVPVSGASIVADDPRLAGELQSTWNFDVYRSGTQPVPAWGTMHIDVPDYSTYRDALTPTFIATPVGEGSWEGTFTGIRYSDSEPFTVRAFLTGQGAYEGLCATLDIAAGTDAWTIDGVIHPLPMGS